MAEKRRGRYLRSYARDPHKVSDRHICHLGFSHVNNCIEKSRVPYDEKIQLVADDCLSPSARSELLLIMGDFLYAANAPLQRDEPRRLYSALKTSYGTRHHTACTVRPSSR
jgi:hypothetical protein